MIRRSLTPTIPSVSTSAGPQASSQPKTPRAVRRSPTSRRPLSLTSPRQKASGVTQPPAMAVTLCRSALVTSAVSSRQRLSAAPEKTPGRLRRAFVDEAVFQRHAEGKAVRGEVEEVLVARGVKQGDEVERGRELHRPPAVKQSGSGHRLHVAGILMGEDGEIRLPLPARWGTIQSQWFSPPLFRGGCAHSVHSRLPGPHP